jgi:hypothetical protein
MSSVTNDSLAITIHLRAPDFLGAHLVQEQAGRN